MMLRRLRLHTLCGWMLALALLASLPAACWALTVNQTVEAAYLKEHPDQFSVRVVKTDRGLLAFTIVRTLAQPKYLVAHLVVRHEGKTVAESDTPLFGKKRDNTFYVSLLSEDVEATEFEISESYFTGTGEDAVPIPGTINYQFRLSDFVPRAAPRPSRSR
jgi:hypothetical protein